MYSRLFILLFFIAGLSACYKDTRTCKCARETKFDFENECRDVEEYIRPEPKANDPLGIVPLWLMTYHPSTERFQPCYNPNNSDEVAFIIFDRESDTIQRELVVANLKTNEHRFIGIVSKMDKSFNMDWNLDGSISYGGSFYYVIDSKSKLLRECNIGFTLLKPRWNPNGKSVAGLCYEIYDENLKNTLQRSSFVVLEWPSLKIINSGVFANETGILSLFTWSGENEIIFRKKEDDLVRSYNKFNFNTNITENYFYSNSNMGDDIDDMDWSPLFNELFVVDKFDGIFRISEGSKVQKRIKKSCTSRRYVSITISPLGDKIIAERKDIKAERDGTYISENTKLVIMDIDGCNEKVLFEDWDGTVLERP